MVSVDSLADNKAFAEKEHADFPMLADPDKRAATAYGVLNKFGLANRWTFYIAPDGTIADIDRQVRPATSGADVVARLKTLKVPERKATTR
jgi:thioredoxin-dependent peroxiredoxin